MNLFDMPSPGQITGAQALVQAAYRAIQYTRIIAERQPDSDSGAQLKKFFLECAKHCPRPMTAEQVQARAEAARIKAEADNRAASSTNPADGRGEAQ